MKVVRYLNLMRFHKPIGIFLLLWPTLMALWVAGKGRPEFSIVVIFVLGVVIMRSAGCVINDYIDRDIDNAVIRTKSRPLATGSIKPEEALSLFLGLIGIAFFLVLQLNWQTIQLSVAGLLLSLFYPWMKRFIRGPQFVLGFAFSWGIPMAFTALKTQFDLSTLWLFLATFCWIIVYDTEYALVDKQDDLKIGVHSTAIWFGNRYLFWIGAFQLGACLFWLLLGITERLGILYFVCLGLAQGCAVFQQKLLRQDEPDKTFQAFINNAYLGGIIYLGILLDYTLR